LNVLKPHRKVDSCTVGLVWRHPRGPPLMGGSAAAIRRGSAQSGGTDTHRRQGTYDTASGAHTSNGGSCTKKRASVALRRTGNSSVSRQQSPSLPVCETDRVSSYRLRHGRRAARRPAHAKRPIAAVTGAQGRCSRSRAAVAPGEHHRLGCRRWHVGARAGSRPAALQHPRRAQDAAIPARAARAGGGTCRAEASGRSRALLRVREQGNCEVSCRGFTRTPVGDPSALRLTNLLQTKPAARWVPRCSEGLSFCARLVRIRRLMEVRQN